jgi:hypothetical protein
VAAYSEQERAANDSLLAKCQTGEAIEDLLTRTLP